MAACEDGINGHYYSYDMEEGGEYGSCAAKSTFIRDKFHYYVYLFEADEAASVKHETDKAYLIQCAKGLFWVPKKILHSVSTMNHWRVHKCFQRIYLAERAFNGDDKRKN